MTCFEKMVLEMRKMQKQYFKLRSVSALEKSRILERQVDAHLKAIQKEEEALDDLFAGTKGEGKDE